MKIRAAIYIILTRTLFPRADGLRYTAENTAGNAILSILFSDSPLRRVSRHPEQEQEAAGNGHTKMACFYVRKSLKYNLRIYP